MANSKFEYVKAFEQATTLLPNTHIVVRIDGRGFHKFSADCGFEKPNDGRALHLMNAVAAAVVKEIPDVIFAYGVSDEFSFIFDRSTRMFDRRESKILTTVVSTFSSYYVHLWSQFFSETALKPPLPSFDGRVILYPSSQNLRDYMSWRQVDCHINNLYNTTFWTLVQRGGMDARQAEEKLKGTLASDKNEILFSEFGINYNKEPDIFKKGSIVYRDYDVSGPGTPKTDVLAAMSDTHNSEISRTQKDKDRKRRMKVGITTEHIDLIKEDFWKQRPWLICDG